MYIGIKAFKTLGVEYFVINASECK